MAAPNTEYITIDFETKKNCIIKVAGTMDEPYFCGKDVCNIFEYSNAKKALQVHVDPENKKMLKEFKKNIPYNDGKAIYINKKGLEQIVAKNKICGPNTMQELVKIFELNLSITPSKEHYHVEAIKLSFPDVEMFTQFKVGQYRVDLYIQKYNLVIECDEFNHRDRDPQKEKDKEEFIKTELLCKFIRFNPDCKNFSIFTVISKIHKVILDHEITKRDRVIKLFKHQLT